MPPGWSPESKQKTAAVVRSEFLKEHEELGLTSRRFLGFGNPVKFISARLLTK